MPKHIQSIRFSLNTLLLLTNNWNGQTYAINMLIGKKDNSFYKRPEYLDT